MFVLSKWAMSGFICDWRLSSMAQGGCLQQYTAVRCFYRNFGTISVMT